MSKPIDEKEFIKSAVSGSIYGFKKSNGGSYSQVLSIFIDYIYDVCHFFKNDGPPDLNTKRLRRLIRDDITARSECHIYLVETVEWVRF